MTAKIWTASSVAIGILGTVIGLAFAETSTAQKPAADDKNWQAVAPGLVEPRSGEIKVTAPVIGLISEVMVRCASVRATIKAPARPPTGAKPRTAWPTPKRP